MATSGTTSTQLFNTRRVIDRAYGRCKVVPEKITAERIELAKDNLYLLLSNLVNRGILLWTIERRLLPFYQGVEGVPLPLGTVDEMNANIRNLTRLSGTYTSSAGGTVDNAFDDDFETECAQASPNGNISVEFTSETLVTSVGILPGATDDWTLFFETSSDGATWTTIQEEAAAEYVDGEWAWYDLEINPTTLFFRVRETGGGTLNVRELFIGNNPNAIPLARINQDDWAALPNRSFPGKPTQFWLDRARTIPIAHTWPVCSAAYRYYQFEVWTQNYVQDVGTLAQEIAVPQRWYEYVVAELAYYLARETPEVDLQTEQLRQTDRDRAWYEAANEERDNSPLMITPQIGYYTR